MGLFIKGMEMPENCCVCPCFKSIAGFKTTAGGYLFCKAKGIAFGKQDSEWIIKQRPNWCPLEEVPTPHGRLIDTSELVMNRLRFSHGMRGEDVSVYVPLNEVYDGIKEAPTIIEAEVDGHNGEIDM